MARAWKALWRSSRRSQRMRRRRKPCSQAFVLSTTYRKMPRPEGWDWSRSARSAPGRHQDRPTTRPPAKPCSGGNRVTPSRWPPVSYPAGGMLWASVMTWCLPPIPARPTRLGPLWGPLGPPRAASGRPPREDRSSPAATRRPRSTRPGLPHVTPEPKPSACGRCSPWAPVRNTNRITATARSAPATRRSSEGRGRGNAGGPPRRRRPARGPGRRRTRRMGAAARRSPWRPREGGGPTRA